MIICLCGPESTGKSRLAEQLAQHYRAHLVAEYARSYLTAKGTDYCYDALDLLKIAKIQWQQERLAIAQYDNVIFDTDLLNIRLWSELRYQSCDPWIAKRATLGSTTKSYLLLSPDIPYQHDPLREETDRNVLFNHWQALLKHEKARHLVVTGQGESRLAHAVDAISSLVL